MRSSSSLNGPDFGPYSGQDVRSYQPVAYRVSTGLTSAHIPDFAAFTILVTVCLNGPDFGPYSGPLG